MQFFLRLLGTGNLIKSVLYPKFCFMNGAHDYTPAILLRTASAKKHNFVFKNLILSEDTAKLTSVLSFPQSLSRYLNAIMSVQG